MRPWNHLHLPLAFIGSCFRLDVVSGGPFPQLCQAIV